MPQMYGDLAINKWVFRAGHFLAPCGYESVMAPENFFYSHSYAFLYGQPTTLTGGEAMYKVNDQFTSNVGIDTGWNNWTDPNGKINYFGGFNWTSKDQKTTLAWETFLGNTDDVNPEATRYHYCLVSRRRSARSGGSPSSTTWATTTAPSRPPPAYARRLVQLRPVPHLHDQRLLVGRHEVRVVLRRRRDGRRAGRSAGRHSRSRPITTP